MEEDQKVNHPTIPRFREYIRPIIRQFVDVIENEFSDDITSNFYENILHLKIVREEVMPSHLSGSYDSCKNQIIFDGEEFDMSNHFTIFHELFHMSSSNGKDVGFHNHITRRGCGINEGYTELLTRKYFGIDQDDYGYHIELSVANFLEDVLGEEKMKMYYMTANSFEFISELRYYLGEDTIPFLDKVDRYTRLTTTPFSILFKVSFYQKMIDAVVDDISKYLAILFSEKYKEYLWDLESYKDMLSKYDKLLRRYQGRKLDECRYHLNSTYLLQSIKNSNQNKRLA